MAESKIKATQPVEIDRAFFKRMYVTNTSPSSRYLTFVFDVESSATGLLSNYSQIQFNITNQDLRLSAYDGSSWTTLLKWTATS